MSIFNISRRTAFNWLANVNESLTNQGLSEVENISKYGYRLMDTTRNKLKQPEEKTNLSNDNFQGLNRLERISEIFWLMVSGEGNVSINRLSEKFACSRNTVIKDLKFIEQEQPNVQIKNTSHGRKIAGDEREIRLAVYELLQKHNVVIQNHIKNLGYAWNDYYKLVVNSQKTLQIDFSENSLILLTYLLMFSCWRIKAGKVITNEKDYYWIAENTHGVLDTSEQMLKQTFVDGYYVGEIVFLSKVVLCSQVMNIDCVNVQLYETMGKIAEEITFRYEQLTGEQLANNFFTRTLCNHLYATYFRVRFGIPFSSNEVNEIKKKYPKLIRFTAIACEPLEIYLNMEIPDNEIALICLYFGSGRENEYSDIDGNDRFRQAALAEVLLVCSSGIGTSEMLYSELSKKYPLIKFSIPLEIRDLKEIFQLNYQAKLVVSTAQLTGDYPVPTIQVKAILTSHDQTLIESQFRKYLPLKLEHNGDVINNLMNIIERYADVHDEKNLRIGLNDFIYPKDVVSQENMDKPSLAELLSVKNIRVIKKTDNLSWREVLHWGCEILREQHIIEPRYESKIVDLINKYGPYMLISDKVFLAHAAPKQGSKSVGISMVLLDEPLTITAKDQTVNVSCLFVLSPGANHEHDRVLEELIEIARNQNRMSQLLNAKNRQDVRNVILSV